MQADEFDKNRLNDKIASAILKGEEAAARCRKLLNQIEKELTPPVSKNRIQGGSSQSVAIPENPLPPVYPKVQGNAQTYKTEERQTLPNIQTSENPRLFEAEQSGESELTSEDAQQPESIQEPEDNPEPDIPEPPEPKKVTPPESKQIDWKETEEERQEIAMWERYLGLRNNAEKLERKIAAIDQKSPQLKKPLEKSKREFENVMHAMFECRLHLQNKRVGKIYYAMSDAPNLFGVRVLQIPDGDSLPVHITNMEEFEALIEKIFNKVEIRSRSNLKLPKSGNPIDYEKIVSAIYTEFPETKVFSSQRLLLYLKDFGRQQGIEIDITDSRIRQLKAWKEQAPHRESGSLRYGYNLDNMPDPKTGDESDC